MATYRLVGSFNGWNPADDTYLLTNVTGNCYKIVWENVAANTEFKITKDGGWDFAVGASRVDHSVGTANCEGNDNIKILNDHDKITVYFFESANTWDCWIIPSIFEYQAAEEQMFVLNDENENYSFAELFNSTDNNLIETYRITQYDETKQEYQFNKHWDAGTSIQVAKYGYGRIITWYSAGQVGSSPSSAASDDGDNVLINESADYLLYFKETTEDGTAGAKYWLQQQISVINVTFNVSHIEIQDLNGEEVIAGEWDASQNYELKLVPQGEGRTINHVQIQVGEQDLTHSDGTHYDETTQTIYLRSPYLGDVTITATAAVPDTYTITLNNNTYHPSSSMDGEYTFSLEASETNTLYLTQVQNEVDSRVSLDNLDVQPAALKDAVTVADNVASFTNEHLESNNFSVSYNSNTGKVTINFAANTVVVNQELHYCKSSIAEGTTVLAGTTITATYTPNSGYVLLSITVNGEAQNIENEYLATITIANYQGEKIIATAVAEINGQEIILHPVSNGEVDNGVDLYPRTTMNNVIVNSAGKKLKDYIDEKCQGGGGSTGTIDFDGVVSGSLNGFNSSVYKFCTNGTTGAGNNEITLKWTQNAKRTISLGRLTVTYLDEDGVSTVDIFDLTQFQAVGSSQTYETANGDVYSWSLNAVEGSGLEIKIANENKTIGEESKSYIKVGTTAVKVTEVTLSSRDFGGRTIQSIEIETYGSSGTNAVLSITAGGVDLEFAQDTTTQTITTFGEAWPSYTATGEVALETGETTQYTNVFVRKVDDALEVLEPVIGALYYNITDKDLYQWRNEVLDIISPTLTIGNGADQAYKGSYGQTNYTNISKLQAMIGSTTEGDDQTITTIELKGTKIKVGNTVISEEQLIALLALLTN